MKKILLLSLAALFLFSLCGCGKNSNVLSQQLSTSSTPAVSASVQSPSSAAPTAVFNPIYEFYTQYNSFSADKIAAHTASLSGKSLMALNDHLYFTTLAMNTVGMLIQSGEDYSGSLFDGFSGSGTILTYPGRYEFSYDFSNSEKLWGTFDGSVLTFYKSISDSENYRKMTLSKTDNGYVSTCRTDNGTTTLSVTADTIEFK